MDYSLEAEVKQMIRETWYGTFRPRITVGWRAFWAMPKWFADHGFQAEFSPDCADTEIRVEAAVDGGIGQGKWFSTHI